MHQVKTLSSKFNCGGSCFMARIQKLLSEKLRIKEAKYHRRNSSDISEVSNYSCEKRVTWSRFPEQSLDFQGHQERLQRPDPAPLDHPHNYLQNPQPKFPTNAETLVCFSPKLSITSVHQVFHLGNFPALPGCMIFCRRR